MKIQLASDLHLEFLQAAWPGERLIAPVPGAEVLVLAGDIADGALACRLFSDWPSLRPRRIIYVAGNHECYDRSIQSTYAALKVGSSINNIHFLENARIDVDGVRFLGATLWTDYRLCLNRTQQQSMETAQNGLNDHRRIRDGDDDFTAGNALQRHENSRSWLASELAKPFYGKTVVVTHHAPHPLSIHPRHGIDPLNAAFASDMSNLMQGVDLWLHGHVHDSFDYRIGNCRVVANPAGYILNRTWATNRERFQFENTAFDKNLLVELS